MEIAACIVQSSFRSARSADLQSYLRHETLEREFKRRQVSRLK